MTKPLPLRHLSQADRDQALGQRIRAAFDQGRAKAIRKARQRGASSAALVLELAIVDQQHHPDRGRAGRIARKLGGQLSERQVLRILDGLLSASDSPGNNGRVESQEDRS